MVPTWTDVLGAVWECPRCKREFENNFSSHYWPKGEKRMIEDWNEAITFVLQQEGGYTLDPNDPGGETNFGISKKAYPNVDIKNLTAEQAKAIYKTDYWQACSCDDLPRAWAIAVFDTGVNQGVGKARRLMQIALGVDVDGVVGPATLAAAAKSGPDQVKMFLAQRLKDYANIMAANQKLLIYALNWCHRVIDLAQLIL
jgi:lysozyme family protein